MLNSLLQLIRSQEMWLFDAAFFTGLHTLIAATLLSRNARKFANWQLGFRRALLGELAVFVVAIIVSAGFLAAIISTDMVRTTIGNVFLGLTPLVFMFLCWISRIKLIGYLVANEKEFRNTADWQLDKVAYSTILQMSFLYIFAGIVAFVTLKYAK